MLLFPTNFFITEKCSYNFIAKGNYIGIGTEVPDYSRRATPAKIQGNASVVADQGLILEGIDGSGLSLNGKYIPLALLGALSFWIKLQKFKETPSDDYFHPIFSQYYILDPKNYHIICGITGNLSLTHMIKRGPSYDKNYSYSVPAFSVSSGYDKWIHIIFNKNNKFSILPYETYVNGEKISRQSMHVDPENFNSWVWTGGMFMDINDPSNILYEIGNFPLNNINGKDIVPLIGAINNLMFFNDALDEDSIWQIYNQQRRV